MAIPRFPASWLPHSLRRQFLLAVSALALLILAGGVTAVYALRTSAVTIHQLAAERMAQMQQAQSMMMRTMLIERESYQLVDAESLADLRESYEEIVRQLTEFDELVEQLAADTRGSALLDLHQSSQLFRNTANVAAQLREMELQAKQQGNEILQRTVGPRQVYLEKLHDQAEALMNATQVQSQRITGRYRDALQRLNEMTQRNMRWVMLLLAASLLLAWTVAQWFLGRHVLGRLQQVSRNLRLGDGDVSVEGEPPDNTRDKQGFNDEIDEMAHAVALFREDRQKLGMRTEELIQARDAAETANKAKSVFLANMSHELRTPLNAILGFSSLMRNDPDMPERQRESLQIINRSGEHLLKLINDVLEMAKIEAGHLQLENTVFDLGAMVLDVTEMMHLRASEKGLSLVLDQSSDFPRFIKGDEARLRQILLNLVSNAVKFTREGGVTIRLGTHANASHHLVMEIEDSGPGIKPEDRPRLFQPFVQLESPGGAHGQDGTGLGLAITREYVQLMGGEITFESIIGKGTRFRVDLPLEPASADEVIKLQVRPHGKVVGLVPGQPSYRVLIAEDQRENLLLMERLMTNIGVATRHAVNGEECVRIFTEWHPDLIWMDRRMPVMDGLEATRRIRSLPDGNKVKIIAVTASAFKEQRQEMKDAGMDELVRKPFRDTEIYDCMTQQLGLKFLYDSDIGHLESEKYSLSEMASMLSRLSADMRGELRLALESLETTRIEAVFSRIHDADPVLADVLKQLADDFDYPGIINALDGNVQGR